MGINVSSGTKGQVWEDTQAPKDTQENFVGPFTAYRSLPPIDFGETAFCPSSLPDKLSGSSQKETGKRQAHAKRGKLAAECQAEPKAKDGVVDPFHFQHNFHLHSKGMSSHLPFWCYIGVGFLHLL